MHELSMVERVQWYTQVAGEFQRIYGMPLHNYFNNITGLDVCRLCDDLKVPKDQSAEKFIIKKYGQRAVDIITPLF